MEELNENWYRIILRSNLWKWLGDTEWIDLAPHRKRWRVVLNAVMNSRFP
jgi:hypothetical protein